MAELVFHMLANAHLDPVWLWDWREGLNEGVITCKTMLKLMRDNPDFTFMRGEASIYQHIEENDPETFAEIGKRVREGRWDIVGGNWVQSDTNLPNTATFLKQFEIGKRYFKDKFAVDVTAAWAADSFGHSAGMPEIFAASGLKYFAFSRPAETVMHIDKPAFWWRGQGGARILTYRIPVGWYGCDRDEIGRRLDGMLEDVRKYGMTNHAVFYGLGNHGGGSSQRQLDDIKAWQSQHPEVEIKFSTLHGFFKALEEEVNSGDGDCIPSISGELNFCLRGCYSSVAKFKYLYRQAENAVQRVTNVTAAIHDKPQTAADDLKTAWKGLLFNTFHDILPGSSIERAYEEQIQWLGGVIHDVRCQEFKAVNALVKRIDTRVKPVSGDNPGAVPFVFFNPLPYEYRGHVELEASLDYRPIWAYHDREHEVPVELLDEEQKPIPFQTVETEHQAMVGLPWRKRLVLPVTLPPFGWKKVSMGYQENPMTAQNDGDKAEVIGEGVITNGIYRIEAISGKDSVRIYRKGIPLFGDKGLNFGLYEDKWGSWGGMKEEPEAFNICKRLESWTISNLRMQENGPERASMWVELSGSKSRLELTIQLYRDRDAVDFQTRIIWNDRAARLKMVMAEAGELTYEIPGGTVKRQKTGDVPGCGWVGIRNGSESCAMASNAFYCYDNQNGEFSVTMCRSSRYATDVFAGAEEFPDRPASDIGELKARFVLTGDTARINQLAEQLQCGPFNVMADPHAGNLPGTGSLLSITPETVKLHELALSPSGTLTATLQNQTEHELDATITTDRHKNVTVKLAPWRITRIALSNK